MQEPTIILKSFCHFIDEEEFGDGLIWANNKIEQLYGGKPPFKIDADVAPEAIAFDAIHAKENGALLYYCGFYLAARVLVENTYLYLRAKDYIDCAIKLLESLPQSNMRCALEIFADMQIAVCDVDSGIYTSQVALMEKSVAKMKANFAKLEAIECKAFGVPYFDQVFNSYRLYCEAVEIIAELNSRRWLPVATFAQLVKAKESKFREIIAQLEAHNDYILSTDLAAQWPALEEFASRAEKNSGEMRIENGSLTICYFATLNHQLMAKFKNQIEANVACQNNCPLNLNSWGADAPYPSEMSDIWSGLADYEFIDTYFWQLPVLSMPFRSDTHEKGADDNKLEFDVELTYYSMGIFALKLSCPIEKLDTSAVRHAITLGTPFASEQKIEWHGNTFGLLSDFVEDRFESLSKILTSVLNWDNAQSLDPINYLTHDNRFVMLRADRVTIDDAIGRRVMSAKEMREHFAFSAFSMPQREARCAIDDWCLRNNSDASLPEISGFYNKNEVLMVSRHDAFLGLTEQPNWSREQAEEVVLTAAIITNLFQSSNIVLSQMLKSNIKEEVASLNRDKLSIKQLKSRISEYEREKDSLEKFSQDAKWLLDIIEAGSMTTYPDHTKMMNDIFEQLNFERQHNRTKQTLAQIKQLQDNIIQEISKIYNRMNSRVSKQVNRAMSAAMALISIGALKDLFDIFNDSKFGWSISGEIQLGIIGALAAMLVVVFIFNQDFNE